jgi:ferredoxin
MPRQNPHRPFAPHPEMLERRPEVSGNAINGLGETVPRRPERVFWSPDPDAIPWGRVQRWFYQADPPGPAMQQARAERQVILDAPMPDLAPERVERAPEERTALLDRFVADGFCELVGVTAMRPEWLFEGEETDFANVVMIGVAHDYDRLATAPDQVAGADVVRQYGRAAGAAKAIAGWLRQEGWEAEAATGPMAGKLVMIPPAIECGFGELGKHGSIINDTYGAAFRLSAVLTDAPFAPTQRREFGVDDFCLHCRVCEDACPPEAILPEKVPVRGEEKWYVDFDKCIPFFAQTSGCAICIAVCPWSRPGVGASLAAKLARRAARQAAE